MRIEYDPNADALYIRLSTREPTGAVEMAPYLHVDTTADEHVVGVEVLAASKHVDLKGLLGREVRVDQLVPKRKKAA
ncbi:MAG: DUF2283 domain-containing protein [Deltaproteobacteria bacterium]|nr:DUF2283 domain-containing protein [Deltaproteobacteria bacterium]